MYSVPPNISLKPKKMDVSMLLYEISSDNSDKLKLATKLGIHVTGYKKPTFLPQMFMIPKRYVVYYHEVGPVIF